MGGCGLAMPMGGHFGRNQETQLLVWQRLELSHLLQLQQDKETPKNVFAESQPVVTV